MEGENSNNPIAAEEETYFPLPIEMWTIWDIVLDNLQASPKSILSCREVCTDFRKKLDKKMLGWTNPPKFNRLPTSKLPPRKYCSSKIYDHPSLLKFCKEMENHSGNPFPTWSVTLQPKCCNGVKYCGKFHYLFSRLYSELSTFSTSFGQYVHDLSVTVLNQASLRQMQKSLFHNFPYLRQLELRLCKINYNSSSWPDEERFRWVETFVFPPLIHLTSLKLCFKEVDGSVFMAHLFNAYGSQITSLEVSFHSINSHFEHTYPQMLPNLKNLRIKFATGEDNMKMLDFLKSGTWPLEQLTIYEMPCFNTDYKFSDWMDVISTFKSTLKIVHLYIFGSAIVPLQYRYPTFEDPVMTREEVDLEHHLQMNVKMPLIEEFSMTYHDLIRWGLVGSMLCEKFENLTTLHVFDDGLGRADYRVPNYEMVLREIWWPILSSWSKVERVIIFKGIQMDRNVVVQTIVDRPACCYRGNRLGD